MPTTFRFAAIAVALVVTAACGGGSSTPEPASSSGGFGAPECDTYMEKYLACIDRMPEEARAGARQALDQTRTTWQQAAGTPQGKAALAATCKAASDAAAASMQAFGCTW